jgi:hypothetical protein
MLCRNCGIEIADKAIVCYRCGTATAEPKFKPAALREAGGWTAHRILLIMLALLVIADAVLWFEGTDRLRLLTWVATAIVAASLIGVRYARRRRSDTLRG